MALLINQLDYHNEGNILATKKYEVSDVIFLRLEDETVLMENIKEYYCSNFPSVNLSDLIVQEGDSDKLRALLQQHKGEDLIVNVTGGKRINSLILLQLCREFEIKAIYIDIKNKKLYDFCSEIQITDVDYEDLAIDDIINAAGGQIIEDSSNLCDKEELIYLAKQIYSNLDIWHEHKMKLYENSIFEHRSETPKRIYIHSDKLTADERTLLNNIVNKFKEMKLINYKRDKDLITVDFEHRYLKSFIFKSGTWLEIATNTLIDRIKEIDESKNGVVFLWNNDNKTLRNEVDVVAVKDSVPIVISCKDSDKYNETSLNELNVYANKIGGENVYKILVATKEPIKGPVTMRAREMGIHLVIFDGNEEKFVDEIKNILKVNG